MFEHHSLAPLIAAALEDPETGWSVGTFGALAEFVRDRGEDVELQADRNSICAFTNRGGVRFDRLEGVRAVAYETVSKDPQQWTHAVALCVHSETCAMNERAVLTELGPDVDALREEDRGSILFDIGIHAMQVDACIRTARPDLITILREAVGQPLFATGNVAMQAIIAAGPHRVFIARPGRVEVYQPIPPPNGRSPDGPHTHILPKLLRSGRTHAVTNPIPEGLVPCAHFYPPHPTKEPDGRARQFDRHRHDSVQVLLQRYGDPDLAALKRRVATAVAAGEAPESLHLPDSRFARAAVRVALRQLRETHPGYDVMPGWVSHFDRQVASDDEDDEQVQHQLPAIG